MCGERMHCWMVVVVVFSVVSTAVTLEKCGVRCSCTQLAVLCRGCPDTLPPAALADRTEHILLDGCSASFPNYSPPINITKLSIINSDLQNITLISPFTNRVESLILQNDSIATINFMILIPNVTFLDLSLNKIRTIQNKTFINITKLKYLDLSKNEIVKLTTKCFIGLNKLQHLDLSLNNMTILSNVFSPLTSLQHLNLSWNQIELLPEGCFSSLLMLQHLDISYNRLTSVAPGALQFLPNLARLLLADNPKLGINQLDGQLLVGTGRRLQQVDASRTGLIQVPEALTHSVRFLTLAGNKISTIRCGDLDSYPLLQTLDFTDNVLSVIEDDALGRLELLSKLYLNNNALRTVPKMLPSELTELSLNQNIIGNITITDLINLPNLKTLLLAKNDIYFIQENVFIQLFSLQVLDLSHNPIQTLTPSTLNGPSALRELNLSYLNISMPATDASFPVSTPEGLERLELQNSPGLAKQLLADTAVLAALTRLQYLDLRYSNISDLRTDLVYYLSQLRTLKLEGNHLECTGLNWLANWAKDNPNNENISKCIFLPVFEATTTVQPVRIKMTNRNYETKNYAKSSILRDVADRKMQYQRSMNDIMSKNDTAARRSKLVEFFREGGKEMAPTAAVSEITSEGSASRESQPAARDRNETAEGRQSAKIATTTDFPRAISENKNDTGHKAKRLLDADGLNSKKNDRSFNSTDHKEKINATKADGEWSRYSAERSRGHPGALVALAGVGLCVAAWVGIYVWGRRRTRRGQRRPPSQEEDIEVSSVAAPGGGLW